MKTKAKKPGTVINIYPKVKRPVWLKVGALCECYGEGMGVTFSVYDIDERTCSSMLLTKDGSLHGRESWRKLYQPENE